MTDEQFREHMLATAKAHNEALEAGRKQFEAVHDAISTLTSEVQANTALTQQIKADTADVINIYRFGKRGASLIKDGAKGGSKFLYFLWPYLVVFAVVMAWYHGDKINLKELIELAKP